MFEKFPIIETERLLLRQLSSDDRMAMLENFSNENVMRYYGMYPITSREKVDKIIENFNVGFEKKSAIRWAIVNKADNKVIGTCGFHCIKFLYRRAEIGYELNENYWRQGLITEAITAIIAYAFESGFNRIEGLVYPENIASQGSLEKIGFEQEGLLREYVCFRDKMQDLYMYALLKNDWLNIK